MNKSQHFSILFLWSVLSLSYVLAVNCDGKQEFVCVEDPTKVLISGLLFDCPDKYICNKDKLTSCEPCIKKSTTCNGKFVCNAAKPDLVIISGLPIQCPSGYTCNKGFEDPCDPCIRKKCEGEKGFECIPGFPDRVIINTVMSQCKTGHECNVDFKYPCTPCIDPKSAADIFVAQIRMKYRI